MRLFDDVASHVEDPFMSRAAALAERGRGATAPNPLVGCVVERDGRIVGEGYHARAGEPHAEVVALADAGEAARGGSMYVTLEPCAHHGRTPPCTDAIVAAGIARVVIGMADPNPLAAGGAARLRAAGVEVAFASAVEPFTVLNEGWLKRLATGRPLVVAKVALSLDGHAGIRQGDRASITGPAGATVTRKLRQRSDAVVVGASTVIADDPALTVRAEDGSLASRQPRRVVLVGSRQPQADARVFSDGAAPTLVVTAGPAAVADIRHAETRHIEEDSGVAGVIDLLGELGCSEVLIEPGPTLFTSLWTEGVIDYLVIVTGGGMAGPEAPPLFRGAPDTRGGDLCRMMEPVEAGMVGDVSVTVWQPSGSAVRDFERERGSLVHRTD